MDHSSDDTMFRLFQALYYDYFRQIGEIWDERIKHILDAQKKYYECAMGAPDQPADLQETFDGALREYVDAVRAAWHESQKLYLEAYANYLRGYCEAWAKAQPSDTSPTTMAIIAQSASTVAGYASSTIGNWWLIAWAGVPPWLLLPVNPA